MKKKEQLQQPMPEELAEPIRTKGYKVFKPDFTCRGMQYELGKTYEIKGKLVICSYGLHFCKKAVDAFNYYDFNPENIVCEIEAIGEIVETDDKCAAGKLSVLRQLPWQEVLTIVNIGVGNTGRKNSGHRNSGDSNSGDRNSGHSNSGHSNSGDSNSGDRNSGDSNSGHRNSGDSNSGHRNSGHRNSGHRNSGDRNSGDSNSGHRNSGDFNSCNYAAGVFNSVEQKIMMFNKPSDWTMQDWYNSKARSILWDIDLNQWIWFSDMTDEEKVNEPKAFVRNGYLKTLSYKEAFERRWTALTDKQKGYVISLPNFESKVFAEITGIKL